ncbi:MAG: hypothetical protein HY043_24080 [Verrucomicrobia bacterium]|nr:hypothetical protein [Verrucomicrobiota bacterium]
MTKKQFRQNHPVLQRPVRDRLHPRVLVDERLLLPEKEANETASQDESRLHDIFNFWKMVLCQEAESAFLFTQELEARVRLFAGMFWAGAVGLAITLVGSFLVAMNFFGIHLIKPDWCKPLALLTGLSLILCALFGSQLRRVRKHEVRQLFTAYLALYRRDRQQSDRSR